MKPATRRELSRNWPIIGIAIVMWLAVVVLRTPALGIDITRVASIIITAGSMFTLGLMWERTRAANEKNEEDRQ